MPVFKHVFQSDDEGVERIGVCVDHFPNAVGESSGSLLLWPARQLPVGRYAMDDFMAWEAAAANRVFTLLREAAVNVDQKSMLIDDQRITNRDELERVINEAADSAWIGEVPYEEGAPVFDFTPSEVSWLLEFLFPDIDKIFPRE